jgi:hypothetical protein
MSFQSLCAPMMIFPSSSFCQKQTQTELQKWVQTQETHHEHQQDPPFPWLILMGGSHGLSLDPWKEGRKEDDDWHSKLMKKIRSL